MIEENLIVKVSRQFIYQEVCPGKAIMRYIGKKEDLEHAISLLRKNAELLFYSPPKCDFLGYRRKKQLQEMEKSLRIAQTWEEYIERYGYLITE